MLNQIIAKKETALQMFNWVQAELQEECDKHNNCNNCPLMAFCGVEIADISIKDLVCILERI